MGSNFVDSFSGGRTFSAFADSSYRVLTLGLIVVLTLYKFWIASGLPLLAPFQFGHDVLWFFLKAKSLYGGEWLAPTYDQLTLIKGPGYPLALAANSMFQISPRITSDVFYVVACIVAYRALIAVGITRLAALGGYCLLLFNPITLSVTWQHLLRISLYLPLTLLLISSLLVLACSGFERYQWPKVLAWSLLAGISLALMWITREETIWTMVAVVPVAAIMIYRGIRDKCLGMGCAVLALLLPVFLLIHWVSKQNERHYGWYGVVEVKEPQFTRAWAAVQSLNTQPSTITPDIDDPGAEFVFVSEVYNKLKIISPATLELYNQMTDSGASVKGFNATYGIWFFRDNVAFLGYYKDAETARSYYRQLANDIEAYCADAPENCRPLFLGAIQLRAGHWDKTKRAIPYIWSELVDISDTYKPTIHHSAEYSGDEVYKYDVGRFFNVHTSWSAYLESLPNTVSEERIRKYHHASRNFMFYKSYFSGLFTFCLIGLACHVLYSRSWSQLTQIYVLVASGAAIFAINAVIVITMYSEIGRPLAAASVSMYLLATYGLNAIINLINKGFMSVFIRTSMA